MYMALLAFLAFYIVSTASWGATWLNILVRLINNVAFVLMPLLVWLISPVFARQRRTAFDWVWTTGLDTSTVVGGHLIGLAVGCALGIVTCVTLACAIMFSRGFLTSAHIFDFFKYASILIPVTCLEFGIVASLSLILRQTLVVVTVIGAVYMALVLGVLMPYASLLTPLNYTLLTLQIDPVAGLGAERAILEPLLWVYVSSAGTFVVLAILIIGLTDVRQGLRYHSKLGLGLLLVMSLSIMSWAGFAYQAAVNRAVVPPPVIEQIDSWRVVSAKHEGRIDPNGMTIDSRLEITNLDAKPVSTVLLALNPGLEVMYATLNGQPAKTQREGETVRLTVPNMTVASGQSITLTLAYRGSPILLREDYSSDQDMRDGETIRFSRPVRGYHDHQSLLLLRDGDWRIWPIVSGAHIAPKNELRLQVTGYPTILSSGEQIPQPSGPVAHTWSTHPPQLLFVAGLYRAEPLGRATILVAPKGSSYDWTMATEAVQLRQKLDTWIGDADGTVTYHAVTLPYVRDVAIGGMLVGVPAVVQFSTFDGYVLQNDEQLPRLLSIRLAHAALSDRIAWAVAPLNNSGEARARRVICANLGENDQGCETIALGVNSSQAPHGRLREPRVPSPALYALSVIVGNQIAGVDVRTQDEERQLWQQLSVPAQAGDDFAASIALRRRGLLPQRLSIEETRRIAQLVKQMDEIYVHKGHTAFATFIRDLIESYPPGGQPLTEQAFLKQIETVFGTQRQS